MLGGVSEQAEKLSGLETDVTGLSTSVGSVGTKQTSLQTSLDSLKKTVDELSKKVNGTGSVTVSFLTSMDSSYTWYRFYSGSNKGSGLQYQSFVNYRNEVTKVIAAMSFTSGTKSLALGLGETLDDVTIKNKQQVNATAFVIGVKGVSVTDFG